MSRLALRALVEQVLDEAVGTGQEAERELVVAAELAAVVVVACSCFLP